MALVDWIRTLRPGSFRGASFEVEVEKADGGRRLKVHEFPHGETPFNEDMGRKARKYSLTAYVTFTDSATAATALTAACDAPGSASLVLPMFGRKKANCESWSLNRSKDKHGYVAFDLKFVEDPGRSILAPLGLGIRLVDQFAGKLGGIGALFNLGFKGLGVAEFVQTAAMGQLKLFSADLLSGLSVVQLMGGGADILGLINRFGSDAAALVASGSRGNLYGVDRFVGQSQAIPSVVPELVGELFSHLSDHLSEDDAVTYFTRFVDYGAAPVPQTTANRKREGQNSAAFTALVRQTALVYTAKALVNRDYTERRSAIQARADISEFIGNELEQVTAHGADGMAVYQYFSQLQGQAVEALTNIITDLAPIIFIEADKSMPSLYWAGRIYDDAARAKELYQRNSVIHAGFMPAEFEAVSR